MYNYYATSATVTALVVQKLLHCECTAYCTISAVTVALFLHNCWPIVTLLLDVLQQLLVERMPAQCGGFA